VYGLFHQLHTLFLQPAHPIVGWVFLNLPSPSWTEAALLELPGTALQLGMNYLSLGIARDCTAVGDELSGFWRRQASPSMSTPRSSPPSYVQKVNLAKIKDGGVVYFLVVFRQILLATSLVTRVVLWYPVIKM